MQLKNIGGTHFEIVLINVYNVETKQIVFKGTQCEAAKFIGTSQQNINKAVKSKYRIKKKFCVRLASNM